MKRILLWMMVGSGLILHAAEPVDWDGIYQSRLSNFRKDRILVSEQFSGRLGEVETRSPIREKTGYRYFMGPNNAVPMFVSTRDPGGRTRMVPIQEKGKRFVRFQDSSAERPRDFPFVSWRLYNEQCPKAGHLFISFDLWMAAEGGGSLTLQVKNRGVPVPPHLRHIKVAQDLLRMVFQPSVTRFPTGEAPASVGGWRHVEIDLPVGTKDDPLTISLTDERNGTHKVVVGLKEIPKTVTDLVLSANGGPDAMYGLDNILIATRP